MNAEGGVDSAGICRVMRSMAAHSHAEGATLFPVNKRGKREGDGLADWEKREVQQEALGTGGSLRSFPFSLFDSSFSLSGSVAKIVYNRWLKRALKLKLPASAVATKKQISRYIRTLRSHGVLGTVGELVEFVRNASWDAVQPNVNPNALVSLHCTPEP
ncbi:MAG TPA: hypothetical protein V6C97_02555, partial [Oculatellaceae cyanobacterium]